MKTGFWLRGGKGKLAGATVYQQNGETVMREVDSMAGDWSLTSVVASPQRKRMANLAILSQSREMLRQ